MFRHASNTSFSPYAPTVAPESSTAGGPQKRAAGMDGEGRETKRAPADLPKWMKKK